MITCPSRSSTKPDPVAPPRWLPSAPLASICTVLGSSFWATAATLRLSGSSGAATPCPVPSTIGTDPEPMVVETATPASTPPTAPTSSAVAATTGHSQPGTPVAGRGAHGGG